MWPIRYKTIKHLEHEFSITTCNGKKGLIRNDNEIILAPIYEDIMFTGSVYNYFCCGNAYIYTDKTIEDELLIHTIGDGMICIKRNYSKTQSKRHHYFFVNGLGETILSIDDKWYEATGISKSVDISQGFIDGKALIRDDINAIYINIKGEIIDSIGGYFADPMDFIDGREYLNYDGYDGYDYYGPNDEEELLYRAAFEDDPGAESNIM